MKKNKRVQVVVMIFFFFFLHDRYDLILSLLLDFDPAGLALRVDDEGAGGYSGRTGRWYKGGGSEGAGLGLGNALLPWWVGRPANAREGIMLGFTKADDGRESDDSGVESFRSKLICISLSESDMLLLLRTGLITIIELWEDGEEEAEGKDDNDEGKRLDRTASWPPLEVRKGLCGCRYLGLGEFEISILLL